MSQVIKEFTESIEATQEILIFNVPLPNGEFYKLSFQYIVNDFGDQASNPNTNSSQEYSWTGDWYMSLTYNDKKYLASRRVCVSRNIAPEFNNILPYAIAFIPRVRNLEPVFIHSFSSQLVDALILSYDIVDIL